MAGDLFYEVPTKVVYHRALRLTTAYWKPNYKDLYGNLS